MGHGEMGHHVRASQQVVKHFRGQRPAQRGGADIGVPTAKESAEQLSFSLEKRTCYAIAM